MCPIKKWLTVLSVVLALVTLSAAEMPAVADGKVAAPPVDPATVEKIIHDYLLKNPEIVIRAIEAYKANEHAREIADARRTVADRSDEIFHDPDSAVGGNLKGDITLVEFFDYRCGVCKRTRPIVAELIKGDGNIRRVYKEWPILGPDSVYASRVAIAARKQDPSKYIALHDALMASRHVTPKSVLAMATKLGFDAERLERDMKSPEVERILRHNFALAHALKLNGTPSFVIGGTVVHGGRDLATFRAIVKAEREKG